MREALPAPAKQSGWFHIRADDRTQANRPDIGGYSCCLAILVMSEDSDSQKNAKVDQIKDEFAEMN